MKTLELKNIKKSFKKKEILHGIDLQIRSSEVFGLLGPNGAGKTTLFSLISGLEMTTSGKIFLDEYDITFKDISFRASKGIIYLPQEPSVFRKLSVADNIKAALQTKFKNIEIEDKYTRFCPHSAPLRGGFPVFQMLGSADINCGMVGEKAWRWFSHNCQ